MNKIGFLRVLYECCRGTGVFAVIPFFSVWRTLWHLFLISILSGLFVASCNSSRVKAVVSEYTNSIAKNFGEVTLGEKLRPENNPETARVVFLKNSVAVYYAPTTDELQTLLKDNPISDAYSLFWTPDYVVGVITNGKMVQIYNLFSTKILKEGEDLSSAIGRSGEDFTQTYRKMRSAYGAKAQDITLGEAESVICSTITSLLFFIQTIQVLLCSLMFVAIFTIFSFISIGFGQKRQQENGPRRGSSMLNYSRMAKVAVYTGFPAIVFASFFPAFELPYLRYDNVFFIVAAAYSYFVMKFFDKNVVVVSTRISEEKPPADQ